MAKELVVTDLAVVESKEAQPGGKFAIETLLKGISPDGTAKTALLSWLRVWYPEAQSGPKDILGQLIDSWKRLDCPGTAPLPNDDQWIPDFSHAPFRLLAITNRFDLQRWDVDGLPLHAGEGRFVFCLTKVAEKSSPPISALVIFEYELTARSENEVYGWAKAWHDLGGMDICSADYLNALAALTERFTDRGVMPWKTNGSALNRIRTNEMALNRSDWKLREFRLNPVSKLFFSVTTKQTPADSLKTDSVVSDFINDHEADILGQTYRVPRDYKGKGFLGSEATLSDDTHDLLPPTTAIWQSSAIKNPEARYLFSLNTCNGCHGAETQTRFVHISERAAGHPSSLSSFLKNSAPKDPLSGTEHTELMEITARAKIMAAVLNREISTLPPAVISGTAFLNKMPALNAPLLTTGPLGEPIPQMPNQELIKLLESRANRED